MVIVAQDDSPPTRHKMTRLTTAVAALSKEPQPIGWGSLVPLLGSRAYFSSRNLTGLERYPIVLV